MASKVSAIFIILNLIFFTCVSAQCHKCTPVTPAAGKCPIDALKLGVCVDLLGLVSVSLGDPPTKPCCTLLEGLANLEAALCLCIAIKANVLGIVNLTVPVALTLLVNVCGKEVPEGFICP